MKSEHLTRTVVFAFLLALVGYLVIFYGLEHLRNRKGPWQVGFDQGTAAQPRIVIDQPWLHITNVQVTFAGSHLASTNSPATLAFGQPQPVPYPVPFGQCVFMDTTFLPGTVTFQLFGHELELLPRVLVIDRAEYPWRSGTNIVLEVLGQ